VITNLILKY